jgi:hypothetical protein
VNEEGRGRTWASYPDATTDICTILLKQGVKSVKQKNHEFHDKAKTRLKKRVFKCNCAGKHEQRALADLATDNARNTCSAKTDCQVVVNLRVAKDGEQPIQILPLSPHHVCTGSTACQAIA